MMTRTCQTCGNVYDKAFEVHRDGKVYLFDCFECAIHALAPVCTRCGLPGDRTRRRSRRPAVLLGELHASGHLGSGGGPTVISPAG